MHTAPFRAQALAGGYDLDPDLPPPDDPQDSLAGLHVLRHVERYLDSLRMELVLTGEWSLEHHLSGDYPERPAEREWRRYRKAAASSTIRRLLREEHSRVPLFHMSGTSCVGWSNITWEGIRLDRYLRPGQLFLLFPSFAHMVSSANRPQFIHLLAWQAPFPSHSLVSWSSGARLCDGPQPLDEHLRKVAGYMFHTGRTLRRGGRGGGLEEWWKSAPAHTLAAPR